MALKIFFTILFLSPLAIPGLFIFDDYCPNCGAKMRGTTDDI